MIVRAANTIFKYDMLLNLATLLYNTSIISDLFLYYEALYVNYDVCRNVTFLMYCGFGLYSKKCVMRMSLETLSGMSSQSSCISFVPDFMMSRLSCVISAKTIRRYLVLF